MVFNYWWTRTCWHNKYTYIFQGVVLYRPKQLQTKLEPSELEYDGEAKKSDISDWVTKNYHGLVGHRTIDNSKDFGRTLVVAYYDVDYVKNAKGTNYWRNRVMKVAKNFPVLEFAVSSKDDFMQVKLCSPQPPN